MQSLDQAINGLDLVELRHIVGKILSSKVEILEWTCVAVQENSVNPNTAGIFRLTGVAATLNEWLDWSLILKISHWDNLAETPLEENYNTKPTDWNYWKREALVYLSGYLTGLDASVIPVKCYKVVEHVDGSIWLWLEDLQSIGDKRWSLDRLILAARHFGEFGAFYLNEQDGAKVSWLCTNFLRKWVKGAEAFGVLDTILNPITWKNEVIKQALPVPVADRIMQLIEDSQKLLSILEIQQKTLCHNDRIVINQTFFLGMMYLASAERLLSIGPWRASEPLVKILELK
jgi:hypothetical protein